MKILFKCLSCEQHGEKRFRCVMQETSGSRLVENRFSVELDTPITPGTFYSLLLKGLYPATAADSEPSRNYECVGDVLRVEAPVANWVAVSVQDEGKLKGWR